jgi:glutamate carboxypeptidase
VTPTKATAGTTINTIPAQAELNVDVRARSLAELLRVDGFLRALTPVDPRVTLTIEGGINRPPLEEAQSRTLFKLARDVATAEGSTPLAAAATSGGSDGNFTAGLGIPTLDGLGPLGDGAHARGEWVSLESVITHSVLVSGLIGAITAGHMERESGS